MIAVDSSRLAQVYPGDLPGSPGFTGADLAKILHPKPVPKLTVTGLSADVQMQVVGFAKPDDGSHNYLMLQLVRPDGTQSVVPVGPLTKTQQAYTAPLDGCQPSCVLAGLFLAQVAKQATDIVLSATTARNGTDVLVKSVSGVDMTESTAWRAALGSDTVGPLLTQSSDGLDISMPRQLYGGLLVSSRIFPANIPAALPAVFAGSRFYGTFGGVVDTAPFGDEKVPVNYVRQLPTIPRLGAFGSMVDLEYATTANGFTDAFATAEVWLAPNTPASMVARLKSAGLTVATDETTSAAVASYRSDSSEAARRYALLGAGLGLALAVIALLLVVPASAEPGPPNSRHYVYRVYRNAPCGVRSSPVICC